VKFFMTSTRKIATGTSGRKGYEVSMGTSSFDTHLLGTLWMSDDEVPLLRAFLQIEEEAKA